MLRPMRLLETPSRIMGRWLVTSSGASRDVDGSLRAKLIAEAVLIVMACFALACSLIGCTAAERTESTWLLDAPVRNGDVFEVQLFDFQRAEAASATYTLFKRVDHGYQVLIWKAPAEIDERGCVTVPTCPDVVTVCAIGVDDDPTPVFAKYLGARGSVPEYEVSNVRLSATPDLNPTGILEGYDVVSARVVFAEGDELASNVELSRMWPQAAYPLGSTIEQDELGMYFGLSYWPEGPFAKKRAEDGSLAPVDEWTTAGGMHYWSQGDFEGQIEIAKVPVSDFAGDFFVQIVVEDAQGGFHGSELAKLDLPAPDEPRTVDVGTDRGMMSFRLEDDYAVLKSYTGEDGRVEVPSRVEDLPVIAVGSRAFEDNEYVRAVVLPKTVDDIGHEAFKGSRIEHFEVSSQVKHIGNAAFAYAVDLKEFSLEGESDHFSVRDGVLYSRDGSRLVAYPLAKDDTFDVPDGVTTIGYAAFAGAGVSAVGMPESLREIEPCAFVGCYSLSALSFPESLERIGSCAFGEGLTTTVENYGQRAPVDSVVIGKNVSYVGRKAFDGLALSDIKVDEGNKRYRSDGGFLISSEGTLLQVPYDLPSPVVVPAGVRSIAMDSLAHVRATSTDIVDGKAGLVDVFLPSSVQDIEEHAFPRVKYHDDFVRSDERVTGVKIHAPVGSWVHSYAMEHGIAHDYVQDAEDFVMHESVVETPTASLVFRVFGDHAELSGIKTPEMMVGHIAVPAEVDGVPVTKLGGDQNDKADGTVKTLIVPASVREVDAKFLSGLFGLQAFRLEGESPWLSERDGVLYSADGQTLVAYPSHHGTWSLEQDEYREVEKVRFDIPDGVREIADYAFSGAEVADVQLPDGLERIGSYAFTKCEKLESVSFPRSLRSIGREAFSYSGLRAVHLNEGLEAIGAQAFGATKGCDGLALPDSLKTIGWQAFSCADSEGLTSPGARTMRIGSALERVEDTPFANLEIERFEVAGDNEHFKANGPLLLSKDGRVLYECASAAVGEIHVPTGVERIAYGAFAHAGGVTDVYVPDSVVDISHAAFPKPADDAEVEGASAAAGNGDGGVEGSGSDDGSNPLDGGDDGSSPAGGGDDPDDDSALTFHCSPSSEAALFAAAWGYRCEE